MSLSKEWKDRLRLFREELERQLFHPVGELRFDGFTTTERLRCEHAREHTRMPMPPGTVYGEKFGYAWFFTQLRIPAQAEGEKLVLRFDLGGEGLIYVNGAPFGTNRADRVVHPYHHYCDLILTESAQAGEEYEISFEGYAGDGQRKVLTGPVVDEEEFLTREPYSYKRPVVGRSWYGVWNEDAYQLYIDMDILVSLRDSLPPDSLRVMEIDNALKECVNMLRMEDGRACMQESFRAARTVLAPLLQCKNGSTAPRMYAFGHSHLDLAWLWTTEETVRKCGRSFSTQLHLMDLYPDYKFLQSQPYLYEQTKQNYPELYARIKDKVKAGQFIPEGGMWVEADSNMPSGESLIRQFLYGKRFFKEEFGVDNEFLWLPDVFGYSAAMPQIMRGCGIRYFSTQKLGWAYNDCDPFPYNYFQWQGLDGSQVLTFLDCGYGAYTDSRSVIKRYEDRTSKDNCDRMLYPYGYGDGGAGPTRDHIENLRRLRDLEGVPKCEMTTPNAFFHDLENGPYKPDHYVGELYFAAHRGVYTSQAEVKKGNRKCEFALRENDVWSALLGRRNTENQERWYKLLLFNQFHDVLPGSGIAEIYQQSRAEYDLVLRESGEFLHKLLARPQDNALTAFNSLSWAREALIQLPAWWEGARSAEGPLPVQKCGDTVYARVNIPSFASVVLTRDTAVLEDSQQSAGILSLPVIENEYLRAEFADDGSLARVYDKELKREWLEQPGNRMRMYRDIPRHFDAWDIDSTCFESPVELTQPAEFLSVCRGPLFESVTYRRRIGNSVLEQTVTLEQGARSLTFNTQIDWNETHKLLKTEFPFALHAEEMYNEIQYGYIKRPTHGSRRYDKDRFEVCNHKWSAIAEETRGAAVLNDCKYGIGGTGGTLSLSLLRASKAPDFHADIGRHAFTYAVYFWDGAFSSSGVVRQGYELNQPATVMPGEYPLSSLLCAEGNGIIVDTVKPAENGDGVVVRAYQSLNMAARGKFSFSLPAHSVTETDMLEQPKHPTDFDGQRWTSDFSPFEVKTFHISGVVHAD